MKVFYTKKTPKVTHPIKKKFFSNEAFMHELESTLQRFSQILFGTFLITVESILQKHAPLKEMSGQIKLYS